MKKIGQCKILIIVLLGLILLSDCQEKSESYDLFGNTIENENLDYVTLTIYMPSYFSSENNSAVTNAVREVFDEIENITRNTLNVHFEFVFLTPQSGNYERAVMKALTEGEPCDMFFVGGFSDLIDEVNDSGLAMDLNNLFVCL